MSSFFEWLILVIGAAILIIVLRSLAVNNRQKQMEEKLKSLRDFSASQQFVGLDGTSAIAVDEERKKVCLMKHGDPVESDIVSYKDILSSEVAVDGATTVTKTSRSSQLGGALVGGLAFGGTGAIIGGLSGRQISSDRVRRIDLRLTVNRASSPIHNVSFLTDRDSGTQKGGFAYNVMMERAIHWHGLIEVLIKLADSEEAVKEKIPAASGMVSPTRESVADELTKLAQLKERGLLTDEEFLTQKAKLLS